MIKFNSVTECEEPDSGRYGLLNPQQLRILWRFFIVKCPDSIEELEEIIKMEGNENG